MNGLLERFMSFDKLMGTSLIKILYWLGILGIALFALIGVISGFGAMKYSIANGLGAIIIALVSAVISLVFWRFMCEIYLLFFRMSDDIRDIKNHQLSLKPNNTDGDAKL